MNTQSSKAKYLLAALAGAAAGGAIVALSTRAVPKMMAGMMAKCEGMMAGMPKATGEAGSMCQGMTAGTGQGSEHATCGPSCNA